MAKTLAPLPVEILLVEDNPGDVRLTQETLKETKVLNTLSVVDDGEKALRYLHRQTPYEGAVRPDLILLDLNIPKLDGREVLQRIKDHLDLRVIPVVVLTTSKADEDILKSYQLHANCYISKPVELEGFITVVRAIENFWLSLVKLPKEGGD